MTSPRYLTRTPSVEAQNDHPDPGGYHLSSRRDCVPRRASLLIARPLLGMSDHPSIPRFLSIPPANPSRGVSHPAQGKRILIPGVGHTWICERQGREDSLFPTHECYSRPGKKSLPHPPCRPKSYSWHTNPFPGKF